MAVRKGTKKSKGASRKKKLRLLNPQTVLATWITWVAIMRALNESLTLVFCALFMVSGPLFVVSG